MKFAAQCFPWFLIPALKKCCIPSANRPDVLTVMDPLVAYDIRTARCTVRRLGEVQFVVRAPEPKDAEQSFPLTSRPTLRLSRTPFAQRGIVARQVTSPMVD